MAEISPLSSTLTLWRLPLQKSRGPQADLDATVAVLAINAAASAISACFEILLDPNVRIRNGCLLTAVGHTVTKPLT
jgi:hypothetical protein